MSSILTDQASSTGSASNSGGGSGTSSDVTADREAERALAGDGLKQSMIRRLLEQASELSAPIRNALRERNAETLGTEKDKDSSQEVLSAQERQEELKKKTPGEEAAPAVAEGPKLTAVEVVEAMRQKALKASFDKGEDVATGLDKGQAVRNDANKLTDEALMTKADSFAEKKIDAADITAAVGNVRQLISGMLDLNDANSARLPSQDSPAAAMEQGKQQQTRFS